MRITNFTGGMVQTNGYLVEIDNSLPRSLQLLDLRGFPKHEEVGADG